MAGLVTTVPQIIWFSKYKVIVFMFSGVMLSASAYLQYRAQFETCPIDPVKAKACLAGRKWSVRILGFSIFIWAIGAFFAFIAPMI